LRTGRAALTSGVKTGTVKSGCAADAPFPQLHDHHGAHDKVNFGTTEEMQMNERPELNRELNGMTFRNFYYLKQELVEFCRENALPVSGGKIELTDRIACFLDTGKVLLGK
jgi:hypothetical protein